MGQSLGQSTSQQKTTVPRPHQQEAKQSLLSSKNRVGMASGKKEATSFEGAKPLPAIGTDFHHKLSNSSIKPVADVVAQRSTFKDSNQLHSSDHNYSELTSGFRKKSGKNRLSDVINEEPKAYRPPVKNFSDGIISGGVRQRKLWRKSTFGGENDLEDIINSNKQVKRDMIEEERTSARYELLCKMSFSDHYRP